MILDLACKVQSLLEYRLSRVERAFDAPQLTERVERAGHLTLVALRPRQRQRLL